MTAIPQAPPDLLSLPPIAIESILRAASFSGALAACSCRVLRDAWRGLASSNPEFAATALVDRFQTVEAAAARLYEPEPDVLRDLLVIANVAPPAPGLLDAVASPLLFTLSALFKKRPLVPATGYLTATAAPDAHALRLIRHLSSLHEGAGRNASPSPVSQANSNNGGGDANQNGVLVADQEQAVRTVTPFPRSVTTGAAFAGHEATVVELLRHGADPIYSMLPGAVRAGNARLCAALLEGGRMAAAASDWSAAAGGDVLGIRGGPSSFVDSYAGSAKATLHMVYMNRALLSLACIGLLPGLPSGSGGGGGGGGDGRVISGGPSAACARPVIARTLLQRAVGWWCRRGAEHVKPAEDVAAALAAARTAAERAADTALGGSSSLLPLFVESSTATAAAAATAATAAALAALTPAEAACSGSSSGGDGDGDGDGGGGVDGSSAHTPGPACAFLSSTTNHAAVRQVLLQWRPAEWQAPPPRIRAAALSPAAAMGAWPVVSGLLRTGVDPWDTGVPGTVLYLALVQGRGAMAAWLLARLLARLLAHPAGAGIEALGVVGAAFAALVTRVMGLVSPLQLLLRFKPISVFEAYLASFGVVVVMIWGLYVLPSIFLPKEHLFRPYDLYLLCAVVYQQVRRRR